MTPRRINYIKAKIDSTLKNSKSRLWCYSDKTVNLIISEYSQLAQKEYKNDYDWVGKVIHWELCKRLKFCHTDKLNMYKADHVLENETYTILINFGYEWFTESRPVDQD